MSIKRTTHVVEPKIVNKMKEELAAKKIPLEELFMSPGYVRYLERIAAYVTGRFVRVVLTKTTETAYTDNKRVYINPMMKINDETFESRNKLVLALLAHELFHMLFTDFSQLRRINTYTGRRNLLAIVNNILEDSYIENVGTKIYVGDFRTAILYVRWMIMEMTEDLDKSPSKAQQLVEAINQYGSCGMLKGELHKENEVAWSNIQPLFDKGRTELDAVERFNCSLEITKIIEKVADEESKFNPEAPKSFFGENENSSKGSSSKDKMSREEIEKALSEIDIRELIEAAKKLLENPEEFEKTKGDEESDGTGLKIAVKGPKKEGAEESSEEGDSPDIIIDLSGEDEDSSKPGEESGEGPVVIKPEKEESPEKSSEEKDSSDKGKNSGDGDSKGEPDEDRGSSTESGGAKKEDKNCGAPPSGDDESECTSSDGEIKISKKDLNIDAVKKIFEEDKAKSEDVLAEVEKETKKILLEDEVESAKSREFLKISDKIKYGANHSRVKNITEFIMDRSTDAEAKYNHVVTKYNDVITQTVRKMKKIIKLTVEEHFTKQRVGNFDVKNSDQLFKGTGKVFQRTKDSTGKDLVFTILVDESGSMHRGDNYINARNAAIVFKELCDSLKIPVLIMGFTAVGAGDGYHRIYCNFDSPRDSRFGLTSIDARSNNRDGYSIRYAGEIMNHYYPKSNKILMVISDGEPADSGYSGSLAKRDTKTQVEFVEKKLNTSVIALNICEKRGIHEGMFKKIVEVPDFTQLPEKLVNILKKEIKRMV